VTIDEAITAYNHMVDLNSRITKLTWDAESKRNQELGVEWKSRSIFSGSWTIPASSADGTQTLVKICRTCGSRHIYDYRIKDGLVEVRTYGLEIENGKAPAANEIRAGQVPASAAHGDPCG
jgi:hypothetical protein